MYKLQNIITGESKETIKVDSLIHAEKYFEKQYPKLVKKHRTWQVKQVKVCPECNSTKNHVSYSTHFNKINICEHCGFDFI
jgi:acetone carboxylase gamma subunit